MKKHIIVGISGGVDSSVAAYLLLEQGYRVEGLFMKNWEEDDAEGYCAAEEDLRDAQSVCDKLGIPLHTVNFAAEYWDRVFAYFLAEYRAGRTPNPDIMCNKEIKFKAFLDYALDLGADAIATGHYVGSHTHGEQIQLIKGFDPNKDQSYFLYTLNQNALQYSLFPLAHLKKETVRQIAKAQGFSNASKKDSTGICFIGERKFRDFLQRFLPAQPGKIVSTDGKSIGEHQGLMYYTLGQRQGLGIGGLKHAAEAPWFVVDKHLENNQLIVAQGHQNDWLMKHQLNASQLHWISGHAPAESFSCTAKIRYRQAVQDCHVSLKNDGQCSVCFPQSQRAITPGQSIVFYNHAICLGGGIIDEMSQDCTN